MAGAEQDEDRAKRYKIYKSLIFNWFLFDYVLPVFFIVIFWPVAAVFLNKAHAFERAFHTADLIPLGSILLLASIREVETEFKLGRMKHACDSQRGLALVICFFLLSAYVLCRYKTFECPIPEDPRVPVDGVITEISRFSFVAVAFCGIYALWLKSTILTALRRKDSP